MFDLLKYKDHIITAAWNSGSKSVSIKEECINGNESEPTLYISSLFLHTKEETQKRFVDSLVKTGVGDMFWWVIVMPSAVVENDIGIPVIKDGVWCYD